MADVPVLPVPVVSNGTTQRYGVHMGSRDEVCSFLLCVKCV